MNTKLLALTGILALAGCGSDPLPTPATVEIVDEAEVAAEEAKQDGTGLSTTQARTVLDELNSICGDTWCEGDYSWDFKKIVCRFSATTCTITMIVTDPGYDEKPDLTYWRACKVKPFKSYADLIQTEASGYVSLADPFYDAMNECIDRIEQKIPVRQ